MSFLQIGTQPIANHCRKILTASWIVAACAFPQSAIASDSLGLSYESLSYSQSGVSPYSDTALKLSDELDKYSHLWEFHISGSIDLVPLSTSSDLSLRTLDGDIAGGLALASTARNRFSLLAGLFYSTSLSNNSSVGYENAVFGEAAASWIHFMANATSLEIRGRLLPELNDNRSGSNYGVGGSLKYTFNTGHRHAVSLVAEALRLKVSAGSVAATSTAFSAGLSIGLW